MPKLQDYLGAPDFDAAITELGASMREALDLPPVYQLGLVVPDISAAGRDLAGQGMPTVFALEANPKMCIVEGAENRSPSQLTIELVATHGASRVGKLPARGFISKLVHY